jgi:hypothetical protein
METKALSPECQIHCLDWMSEPLGRVEIVWQLRNRLKRITKRRLRYFRNWLSQAMSEGNVASASAARAAEAALQAGDLVRVRSREQIQATLDRWNRLKGCDIMEEMWQYCGTTQRVLRRVDRFLDERDYRVKRCKGIILLEGVRCEGTVDYGPCDRSCYYFWREEWLEKIG